MLLEWYPCWARIRISRAESLVTSTSSAPSMFPLTAESSFFFQASSGLQRRHFALKVNKNRQSSDALNTDRYFCCRSLAHTVYGNDTVFIGRPSEISEVNKK